MLYTHCWHLVGISMEKTQASRRIQKNRDRTAERSLRRWKRDRRLSSMPKLPEDARESLLMRGLARPVDSVRGMLLEAILRDAVRDSRGVWLYDGSIRDLADGGLKDGNAHDLAYLSQCMQAFVDAGVLKKYDFRKGRPVIYEICASREH